MNKILEITKNKFISLGQGIKDDFKVTIQKIQDWSKSVITEKKYITWFKVFLWTLVLSTYFIAALSFKFIANDSSNYQAIIGFSIGLFASCLIAGLLIFRMKHKPTNKIKLVVDVFIIVGIILAIFAIVMGTIGYITLK